MAPPYDQVVVALPEALDLVKYLQGMDHTYPVLPPPPQPAPGTAAPAAPAAAAPADAGTPTAQPAAAAQPTPAVS